MSLIVRFPVSMLFIIFLVTGIFAGDEIVSWRRVSPAELSMNKPVVEPDADAEAIFWEVWLDDKKRDKLFYTHYARIKIFTERGRERFSKFDIPFMKGKTVEDVAARVIKPDGAIIELNPSDIFERDIVQVGKVKVRAKSFAVPGIEPGVIIEFRYKETLKSDSADGEHLIFQRDIPVQKAVYHIRPYSAAVLNYDFRNMSPTEFQSDTDGFYVATVTNVPAFKKEPQMPPDEEARQWAYLFYGNAKAAYTWNNLAKSAGPVFKEAVKTSKAVRQKAEELTANVSSREETLRRIYEFTQKRIKNTSYDLSSAGAKQEKIKIKDADEVLKSLTGGEADINFLFASLAGEAGFTVALTFSGDRSESFFNPEKNTSLSYVHPAGIAVVVDNGWKFFNPGIPYMPYGKLFWFEEGVSAMLLNEADFIWGKTTFSDYSQSPAKRNGKFKLLEDGTLEGAVRFEYNGQQAIMRRHEEFKNSAAKREENLKEEIKLRMSAAEISDLTIENFEDASMPLTYSFKIRVPNYAQKTGKRLFVQPGFFEYGTNPLFSSSTRIHQIYFDYAWSEEDDIEIELPKGFAAETVDSPDNVVEGQNLAALTIDMNVDKAANLLKYQRKFFFGGGGHLLFKPKAYEPLKFLFDSFHKTDMHKITLKQGE